MSAALVPAPVPTSEYRALMLYDKVPAGCFTWLCANDKSIPHVKPGEWVVIDPSQRKPLLGEMYLIKFGPHARNEHLCLTTMYTLSDGRRVWMVGSVRNSEYWAAKERVIAMRLPFDQQQELIWQCALRAKSWSEGPYEMAGRSYDHLCHCLQGMVIGIYQAGEAA